MHVTRPAGCCPPAAQKRAAAHVSAGSARLGPHSRDVGNAKQTLGRSVTLGLAGSAGLTQHGRWPGWGMTLGFTGSAISDLPPRECCAEVHPVRERCNQMS
eukprot:1154536-Pelagomonas_calceolata.AAC.4